MSNDKLINQGQNDKLQQERYWVKATTWLLTVSILSGVVLTLSGFISDHFSYWLQFNVIGHTILSSIATLPLCIYSYIHFRRTTGIRSPALLFSGLLSCLFLLIVFISGFWIAIEGQQEKHHAIASIHGGVAYAIIIVLIAHIISHIRIRQQKKRDQEKKLFITISSYTGLLTLGIVSAYFLSVTVLSVLYSLLNVNVEPANYSTPNNQTQDDAYVYDYVYDYGDHPFRPSQTETVGGGFVKTEQIAKSEQCGSCHTDIYQQWLSSAHRQAASDPAYVKNITLLEKNRGITATRYCEGCHAPVALLTGELTPGGKHGGIIGTPAHAEGVGCLGCHGISKIVHLNGTASYEFDPKEHYLFDSHTQSVAQKVRNFLIRLKPEPHKKAMAPDLLQDSAMCASCHEQFMDKSMNDWGWVKMQSEYNNWLASPFSGQNEQHFQSESVMECQSCHFPLVKGNDPSADSNGLIHSHRSLGANTVLPFLNGDDEQLEATKRFLQSAKILVDIEEPHRQDNIQNHQFIDQQLRPNNQDNTPFFFYLGEQATVKVVVTNRMVGHTFPAGTLDINQAWIDFTVTDADNREVYRSGALNEALELDKTAHTYHAIPVDRQGKHIWKHDLFRMVGDAYKNVIAAGKSDIKEYTFTVPAWAKEPLTATAIVKYRKFNQRYARWALDHPKPVLPIVDMARDSLTIPLKVKPVIEKIGR